MSKVEEFLSRQRLTQGMRSVVDQALRIQASELKGEKKKTKKSRKNDTNKGSASSDIQPSAEGGESS